MIKKYMELWEWCTLVNEKCEHDNCDGCPNNIPKMTKHEENLQMCEFVTVTHLKKTDINVTVNRSNDIGRFENTHDVKKYITYHQLDKCQYHPNFLKQYPLFFILKRTLGMGVPREIYPKKDMPCVVFFDEDVYLFAPRIDND